jgi:hypothetical protein
MNFNNINIISTLGVGKYGTTYLVKYNNVNYALKIQHIYQMIKIVLWVIMII